MDDDSFLSAFEAGTLPGDSFDHRSHVRMAWLVLRRLGKERGAQVILDGLRRYVVAQGAQGKYHQTLTVTWIHLVDAALRRPEGAARDFEAFLAEHPDLCDSRLVYRHYRKETLDSPEARQDFVAPDLLPLP